MAPSSASELPPFWLDLVGFNIEKGHTGVLWWLLKSNTYSKQVAREVLGEDIVDVAGTSVRRERKASPELRTADLTAEVKCSDPPKVRQLVVETKVDSTARWDQLGALAAEQDFAVLLAVGIVGLQLGDLDTREAEVSDARWQVVDAPRWKAILDGLPDLPPAIDEYRERLSKEVDVQQQARSHAWQGSSDPQSGADYVRDAELLRDWAWLAEVRSELDAGHRRTAMGSNERWGPILHLRGSRRPVEEGVADLYFDLAVESGQRKLVLRGDVSNTDHRDPLRDAVLPVFEEIGFTRRRKTTLRQGWFSIAERLLEANAPDSASSILAEAERARDQSLPAARAALGL